MPTTPWIYSGKRRFGPAVVKKCTQSAGLETLMFNVCSLERDASTPHQMYVAANLATHNTSNKPWDHTDTTELASLSALLPFMNKEFPCCHAERL